MALIKRYFKGLEGVEKPSLTIDPFSPLVSSRSVSEAVEYVESVWAANDTYNTIIVNESPEAQNLILSCGSAEITLETMEYHLRNDMVGYDIYCGYFEPLCRGIAAVNRKADLIVLNFPEGFMDIGLSYNSEDVLEVLDNIYDDDPGESWRNDGMPWVNFPVLEQTPIMDTMESVMSVRMWEHWVRKSCAKAFDRVFGTTARRYFGSSCKVVCYDFSKYKYADAMDFTVTTTALPFSYYGVGRHNVSVGPTGKEGPNCPLLIANTDFHKNETMLINTANCAYPADGELIPMVSDVSHEGEENYFIDSTISDNLDAHLENILGVTSVIVT